MHAQTPRSRAAMRGYPLCKTNTRRWLQRIQKQRRRIAPDRQHEQLIGAGRVEQATIIPFEIEHHHWHSVQQELLQQPENERALASPRRPEEKSMPEEVIAPNTKLVRWQPRVRDAPQGTPS
jgi:hypothetical protein